MSTPPHPLPRVEGTPATLARLLNDRQAGTYLGVCPKTIANMAKRGDLTPVRIGRATRYDRADLDRFIERAKATTPSVTTPTNIIGTNAITRPPAESTPT